MKRGQVRWADLAEPRASEPGYRRPVLVVQADEFNASRISTIVVVALTSNIRLASAPGNLRLSRSQTGLDKESVVNVSQILTLDKSFISDQLAQLDRKIMSRVDEGMRLVLGL